MDTSTEFLRRLVAFPTVSDSSNLALLDWIEESLAPLSPRLHRFPSPDGSKANLLLSFGPDLPGGLLLSGHTDVVPVTGQRWSADPWTLREADGRLTGRGATDMKGFLACCLTLAQTLGTRPLRRPVHLALSYDEEVGCTGVGPMAEWAGTALAPALAVIGEPSRLGLVNAHKGGLIGWATVTGKTGHSSQPQRGVDAVRIAADCVGRVAALAAEFRAGPLDPAFDPPWSTAAVNVIQGGNGMNLIAESCRFSWEMRVLPGVDELAVFERLKVGIEADLVPAMQAVDPGCGIRFEVLARINALSATSPALEGRLLGLLDQAAPRVVAYGSEAGIFQAAGIPSVIIGPGDIAQAHQPDEWIETSQLLECTRVLDRLVTEFCG